MAFCTKCGSEIDDIAAPCPKCGHVAADDAPADAGEAAETPGRRVTPGRLGLVALGVLLLIAFFMPIYDGASVVLPDTITLLKDADVPFSFKVEAVYPLLAGLAVIVLAFTLKGGVVRALAVTALGLFLPVLVLLSPAERSLLPAGGVLALLTQGAGIVLVFAGSRARRFCPSSLLGAVVGAVGGVVYMAAMILPILPEELGRAPIVQPVALIISAASGAAGRVTAIASGCLDLLAKVLLIAASVVCLMNAAPRPVPGLRTRKATRLWIWSVIVLFITAFVPAVILVSEALGSSAEADTTLLQVALPALSSTFKVTLPILGLFLLLPVGLAHLVVHFSAPEPGPLPGYAETTTGTAAAQAGPAGLETRLRKLQQMRGEGLISQEDFEKKKEQILSEM